MSDFHLFLLKENLEIQKVGNPGVGLSGHMLKLGGKVSNFLARAVDHPTLLFSVSYGHHLVVSSLVVLSRVFWSFFNDVVSRLLWSSFGDVYGLTIALV